MNSYKINDYVFTESRPAEWYSIVSLHTLEDKDYISIVAIVQASRDIAPWSSSGHIKCVTLKKMTKGANPITTIYYHKL
jgi:hypothetical protein